ncbi:MAG: glucose-1-phosphate cytidylyltransferase [Candidatus Rokubacteria bacterium]|nr:glucose-1-phosphate cytidylyltransferase [Candidatus Rokubacteria bacterium]
MKVVLFCGGQGTRIREYSDTIPKPMIPIGYRPMLWHVMKYYAHFGHTEFILCLGYRGDVIKHYFLNYDECLSNDFVLSNGGRDVTLHGRDIEDWKITFVDTGLHANVGQRLRAVEPYLAGERVFLANYADGLSDLPLDDYLEHFHRQDKIASFLCVKPSQTFHAVTVGEDGLVRNVRHATQAGLLINGGFFALKQEIFEYMGEGEELVEEPFRRLITARQLLGYTYSGFWQCMDTFKDKQLFDDMNARGYTPWEVWRRAPASPPVTTSAVGVASRGAVRPR